MAKDGEPVGPITFQALATEIKERRLARDVLVWNETFSDWKSAADVPELARLLPPPVPVPPASAVETPQAPAQVNPNGDVVASAMDQPAAALSPSSSNEDIADLSLSDVEPLSWSGVEEVRRR